MGSYLSRYIDDSAGEESGVTSFHSSERWQLHLNAHKESSQLLVVDFSASWCGPCRFIEPAIRAMAAKFTDVQFAKIDVNELSIIGGATNSFSDAIPASKQTVDQGMQNMGHKKHRR